MKLYVKSPCFVCHNKTQNCYACDATGYEFIEATDKTIFKYILELDPETKIKIIDALQIFKTN